MSSTAYVIIGIVTPRPGRNPQVYQKRVTCDGDPASIQDATGECLRLIRDGLAEEGIDWNASPPPVWTDREIRRLVAASLDGEVALDALAIQALAGGNLERHEALTSRAAELRVARGVFTLPPSTPPAGWEDMEAVEAQIAASLGLPADLRKADHGHP